MKKAVFLIFSLLIFAIADKATAQHFNHPGLLQDIHDLERIKKGVTEQSEPIYSGFVVFKAHQLSQKNYQMQGPLAMVSRKPTVGQGNYDSDAGAAYQNAIMWVITGDRGYAIKAQEIINSWSLNLKKIGGQDAVLMAGLGPFKMINAAEILRYTNSGWSAADIAQTQKHFREVVYPVIKDYALFANGNWDNAAVKTVMAIGVFCNDRNIFENGLHYYVDGAGDGSLKHYVVNEDGQCQESGRDQAHTQLGLGHLADCAEIAWHQGLDLYGYANNRLLKGFEYTAKYNLGLDVPYVAQIDQTGKYFHENISGESRGKFRAIYEQVYNHYVNRAGLDAPFTKSVAEKLRPELQGSGGDNVGFGTLLFSRKLEKPVYEGHIPAQPAGIIAKALSGNTININWIAVINADTYIVQRATDRNGPYVTLNKNLRTPTFTDKRVKKGVMYYYRITAVNRYGMSDQSVVSSATALRRKWLIAADIEDVQVYGGINGPLYELKAKRMLTDSTSDLRPAIYQNVSGDCSLTVRFVPQFSAQTSSVGLSMASGPDDHSNTITLALARPSLEINEEPGWKIILTEGNYANNKQSIAIPLTDAPFITYGRVTGQFWLRLIKQSGRFTGYVSEDGKSWKKVGLLKAPAARNYKAGVMVASGNIKLATTVKFDNVSLKKPD
nr:alginate lyase family protein [uncultured Mucilaginibacter sp.]